MCRSISRSSRGCRSGSRTEPTPRGEKVPAVRELALQAGVNPNTMQRALAELERDGYLRSERTSGRYVTVDQERLASLRKELGDMFIKEMVEKMRELGMDHSQIVEAVTAWKESK